MTDTTLYTVEITERFLKGHLLYGCRDYISRIPNCSRVTAERLMKRVGTVQNYKELREVEIIPQTSPLTNPN